MRLTLICITDTYTLSEQLFNGFNLSRLNMPREQRNVGGFIGVVGADRRLSGFRFEEYPWHGFRVKLELYGG